jgi:acyl-CoA oxidase
VLGLMRTLYVLSAADQGPVFMRYGYLSTTQSQLIAEEVAALCAEVWPHALNLVHSFGIPQSFFGPIASNWIEYNSWANVQQ